MIDNIIPIPIPKPKIPPQPGEDLFGKDEIKQETKKPIPQPLADPFYAKKFLMSLGVRFEFIPKGQWEEWAADKTEARIKNLCAKVTASQKELTFDNINAEFVRMWGNLPTLEDTNEVLGYDRH
jgi:hypothetical protein